MPMGVEQLLQTVFNCSLAIVRFMMKKSMHQKPEVNIVITSFILSNKELTKCLNYKLKRLNSSLLIFCIQNKRFNGGLAVVSFPSSWFEAKVKLREPNFRCSALKCVEAQQLNVGLFFVLIASDQER